MTTNLSSRLSPGETRTQCATPRKGTQGVVRLSWAQRYRRGSTAEPFYPVSLFVLQPQRVQLGVATYGCYHKGCILQQTQLVITGVSAIKAATCSSLQQLTGISLDTFGQGVVKLFCTKIRLFWNQTAMYLILVLESFMAQHMLIFKLPHRTIILAEVKADMPKLKWGHTTG